MGRASVTSSPGPGGGALHAARLTTVASDEEDTTERLLALVRTTVDVPRLDADGRQRLEQGFAAVVDGAGGIFPLHSAPCWSPHAQPL